ncbi:hypothetical protein TH53_16785 [Pedobacter lusitanus]|uniref:Helix-turn-helix domain-containing protein n=1 Tax=Pedobacter lusitanus TaxID=1503925 RepID=A0A0D0F3J2_9SPHI|nr:helix-turn-helix domain-containing protein [Pedobacter lusitanus]KIO76128.1 hypothetical protein TH53_16785 [Pedobacter lusitanus]
MLEEINKKIDLLISLINQVVQLLGHGGALEEAIYLTLVETASMLKVTERTIRRWHTDGLIKAVYIGGSMHFSKKELLETIMINKLNKK